MRHYIQAPHVGLIPKWCSVNEYHFLPPLSLMDRIDIETEFCSLNLGIVTKQWD